MRQSLNCEDWRTLEPERMARLYEAEVERWSDTLEWDTAADWDQVEQGRRRGSVPGVIVTNESGEVEGWSFHVVHDRVLQIGGFLARSEACRDRMLDEILTDTTVAGVDSVTFFAFADAPALAPALRDRRFGVERYWYMGRPVDTSEGSSSRPGARRWEVDDSPATAELLRRAYAGPGVARPFAPGGTSAEWTTYLAQLVGANGCGRLMPEASFCVPGGPSSLAAVVLTTRIAERTGHIAQLVVDPEHQRNGLGNDLLAMACAAAARRGCHRVTLLVAAGNRPARQLYEHARFEIMGSFVAGRASQPWRLTKVAPGASVMTLR